MGVSVQRQGRRAAVVAGLRTPFLKAGGDFAGASAIDLGSAVVAELVSRAAIEPSMVDLLVFGQVLPSPLATFVAREVALRSGLPPRVEAHTVSRACATSLQALTSAIESIERGHGEVAVAGGTECVSDAPLFCSRPLTRALTKLSRAKSLGAKLSALAQVRLRDLAPEPPVFKEPSTGLTMGESAEKMARDWGIGRQEQDRLALESHRRACAARAAGRFDGELMPTALGPGGSSVEADGVPREDASLEALARLRPAFASEAGTITAGNSSPLTDGAAALLLMSEEKARSLGREPLGFVRSWAYAGLDPREHLLLGPAYSVPLALDRAGLTLKEMALVEVHEAFAAQTICNLRAFASRDFAREKLGRDQPVGEVDPAKLNVNGGAIALGHPFAASGARMVASTLRELQRRGEQFALVTLCTAGGMGAAVVLERA